SKFGDGPSDHTLSFGGVDADGKRWNKQVTLRFVEQGKGPDPSKTAKLTLESHPGVVVKQANDSTACGADHPYYQVLVGKEVNGPPVKLTKFIAGGFDYSNDIAKWFLTTNLPANEFLNARMCWQVSGTPVYYDYEVSGVDASGRPVTATLKVKFSDDILD